MSFHVVQGIEGRGFFWKYDHGAVFVPAGLQRVSIVIVGTMPALN